MSERDLTAIERDRIAEWDRASVGRAERTGEPSRAGDAAAFEAVGERDQEALLSAARGVAKRFQRPARAIGVWHRAIGIVPQAASRVRSQSIS